MAEFEAGGLNAEDLARLLKAIEESRFAEVELRYGELRFYARKDGAERQIDVRRGEALPAVAATPAAQPRPAGRRVEVKAPTLGTFYLAPSPGAPPFVEVGAVVKKGDTIGLIEVMKLFTPVPATVDGTVVEILAKNAALVEHGETLVMVEVEAQ